MSTNTTDTTETTDDAPSRTFVIDLDRCTGCWACAIACRMKNDLPEGEWWIRVETVGGASQDTSSGVFPNVEKHYRPVIDHCSEGVDGNTAPGAPACAAACPTRAIEVSGSGQAAPEQSASQDRPTEYAGRVDEIDVWYRPPRDSRNQRRSGNG
jgi:Fe-S-cluster-containing dehydrogenase component